MEELFTEKIESECGQCAKNDGEDLESDEVVAEYPDGKRLKIDEQPFAAEIGWIEEIESVGLEGMERIDAIGCLIRIEPDRNRVEVIDTEEKRESQQCCEQAVSQGMGTIRCTHSMVGDDPAGGITGRVSRVFHFSLLLCYHYTEIEIKNK